MKLLKSIKSKITKSKNGENVPHSEINEVVLVHINNINNYFQYDLGFLYTFVPNKSFGHLLDISAKNLYLQKLIIRNFHILKYCLLIKILNS